MTLRDRLRIRPRPQEVPKQKAGGASVLRGTPTSRAGSRALRAASSGRGAPDVGVVRGVPGRGIDTRVVGGGTRGRAEGARLGSLRGGSIHGDGAGRPARDEAPAPAGPSWRGVLGSVSTILLALVTAGAVLVAVAALLYVDRTASSQRRLLADGNAGERFAAAVEQLGQEGPDNLQLRLGGVYGLERIMRTSPDDERAVVELLAAFVRGHAPGAAGGVPPSESAAATTATPTPTSGPAVRPAADVQAALQVLGRRPTPHALVVDLREADLPGVELPGADLRRTSFVTADLSRAQLTQANLGLANLAGANLTSGRLVRANLQRTVLVGANLTRASLASANLAGADLTRAILTGADLSGADLRGTNLADARGLNAAQVAKAIVDDRTRLPAGAAGTSPATASPTASPTPPGR